MRRLLLISPALAAGLLLLAAPAAAQSFPGGDLLSGSGGMVTGRMVQLIVLLTVLSVAPGLLVMVTSFTRIVVALAFLRSGMGLQSTPANLILLSLALFMTFFVMQPTFEKAWEGGVRPMMENRISQQQAWEKVTEPFREFMLEHVREKDIALFRDLAAGRRGGAASGEEKEQEEEKAALRILVPAFMISELRRGFEMGFLIALPFLVIDLIVATITMSMGMMMLPPTVISLPFKILFFVLIDGWNLLAGGLVRSFF